MTDDSLQQLITSSLKKNLWQSSHTQYYFSNLNHFIINNKLGKEFNIFILTGKNALLNTARNFKIFHLCAKEHFAYNILWLFSPTTPLMFRLLWLIKLPQNLGFRNSFHVLSLTQHFRKKYYLLQVVLLVFCSFLGRSPLQVHWL